MFYLCTNEIVFTLISIIQWHNVIFNVQFKFNEMPNRSMENISFRKKIVNSCKKKTLPEFSMSDEGIQSN